MLLSNSLNDGSHEYTRSIKINYVVSKMFHTTDLNIRVIKNVIYVHTPCMHAYIYDDNHYI